MFGCIEINVEVETLKIIKFTELIAIIYSTDFFLNGRPYTYSVNTHTYIQHIPLNNYNQVSLNKKHISLFKGTYWGFALFCCSKTTFLNKTIYLITNILLTQTLVCIQGQRGLVGQEGFVGRPGPRGEVGLPGLPGERGPFGQKVKTIIGMMLI